MGLKDLFNDSEFFYTTKSSEIMGKLVNLKDQTTTQCLYSVNPLSPNWQKFADLCEKRPSTPRFSLNVTTFRNFVFESDTLDLESQLNEWLKLAEILPIKLLTYSGGKSYHAIISCLDSLPFEPHTASGVAGYKQAWKGIKGFIETNSKLILDPSTKDPARLSRIPEAFRGQTKQSAQQINSRYISSAEVLELMAKYAPFEQVGKRTEGPAIGSPDLALRLAQPQHRHLKNKIKYPEKWVSSENMYPKIIRLTLWAIDELNPEPEAWLQLLESTVFPAATAVGYKRDLTIGVRGAYAYKGIKV